MDFITIGEMLIDFLPGQEEGSYIRNAGGAPGNVAISAARNGLKAGMYCKVGNDDFGKFLLDTLRENHVTPLAPEMTDDAVTTMAFVSLNEYNDRSFTFARKPGADMLLSKSEIKDEDLKDCRLFQAGSLTLSAGPAVEANEIYGGTFNLFGVTLKKLGIECTFVNPNDSEEEIQKAFRPNTKVVFGETISNPGCAVLDIEKFARIAHKNGVPLIVDNTFATPINCRPFEWGADIVTHSTTKYMDGTASQVGGVVVDSGNFDWMAHADKFPGLCTPDDSYHGLTYVKAFGKMGYTTKLVAQLMRDLGSIPAPMNSFILNLGLQSLHLRMRQHCANAQKVAEFLQNDERVAWVHYSGLEGDEYHALAQKYMPNGTCGVIAFGLKGDRETAIKFMDSLDMINKVLQVERSRIGLTLAIRN